MADIPDKLVIPGEDGPESMPPQKGLLLDVGSQRVEVSVAEAFDLLAHLSLMLRGYHERNRH